MSPFWKIAPEGYSIAIPLEQGLRLFSYNIISNNLDSIAIPLEQGLRRTQNDKCLAE